MSRTLLVGLLVSSILSTSLASALGEKQEANNSTKEAINLKFGNKEYQIVYMISNSKLLSLRLDLENKGLVVLLGSTSRNGDLQITFPRELLDAKNDTKDASFKVLVNNKQNTFKETTNTALTRGVSLTFPAGAKEVKIIGTYIVSYSTQDGAPKDLKQIPAVIVLDPLPSWVTENTIVYFTGKLNTIENMHIQGATVWIRYTDSSGNEPILGSATTDTNGKFTAKWSSKINGVNPMNVYAVFDGNDDYLKSKSDSFGIVVKKQKPSTIVAYTNKNMYQLEDTVVVSGTVKHNDRSTLVGIEVINPEGRHFKAAQTPINDGSFSFEFRLGGEHAVPGRYTLIVNYWYETFKTSFLLDGEDLRETIETVLRFSHPPLIIEEGDRLLFTGSLMSNDKKNGVSGAVVWIKYRDESGEEHALVSAMTDDEGRFSVKWRSNFSNSGTVHMYAVFDGKKGFASAVSQEHEVTLIAEPDAPLLARTDKQSYVFGETVKITGRVTPVIKDVPVLIQIIDQQHLPSKIYTVNVSPDGSFKHEFKIAGSLTLVGTCKIRITYNENTEILPINVNRPKFDIVTVEDLVFVNAINLPVNELQQGKTVFLKSVMRNNVNADQSLVYVVQIQDSEKTTVLIESLQYVIPKGEKIAMEIPWVPEFSGSFTVNTFVIESEENPVPLALKPTSLQVSIHA